MIGLDTASISEFAIVVAGFAGLIVAVAQRGGRVHPLDKYRMVTMLLYAFTAAFGALLPPIMRSFGIEGDEVWRQSGLCLALLITANLLGTQLYHPVCTTHRGRTNRRRVKPQPVPHGSNGLPLIAVGAITREWYRISEDPPQSFPSWDWIWSTGARKGPLLHPRRSLLTLSL